MAESVVAAIVLIPVALGLLDLIVLVLANSMNDTAAKNAARAAANQENGQNAGLAAQNALSSFRASSIVQKIDVDLQYNTDDVTAETTMTVHLPVPFPGLSDLVFKAKDVEPIVVKQ